MDAIGDPRSDPELLAAALTGDGAAFGAFYRRHARRVAAFHLARAGCAQDAADLTAATAAPGPRPPPPAGRAPPRGGARPATPRGGGSRWPGCSGSPAIACRR